jgi:ubiquinone/menaquinone biosynthesis C-methylase UbiE
MIMSAVHRGDVGTALATIDAGHAELARDRVDVAAAAEAFAAAAADPGPTSRRTALIGQVARAVGVRTSRRGAAPVGTTWPAAPPAGRDHGLPGLRPRSAACSWRASRIDPLRGTLPEMNEPSAYDQAFRTLDGSRLMRELWAEAMVDQYPDEVDPFSSCCWWLLGQLVAGLRLTPGGTLVDLGCGRGGPGLWLARALSAHLVAVDFSPVAIELTRSRAPAFLADGRVAFRVAEFSSTGLGPGTADGVVSVDALPFAPDRDAALREIHRILSADGRLVFTATQNRAMAPDDPGTWERHLDDAGFDMETRTVNPFHHEHWRRLYALWHERADDLRADLGEAVTDGLLAEAAGVDRLDHQEPLVFVARRRPG